MKNTGRQNAEVAAKVVKDLIAVELIREVKYTWLPNVVLIKKSNEKWRMCVDYTELNDASPVSTNWWTTPHDLNSFHSWTHIHGTTRFRCTLLTKRRPPRGTSATL